MTAQAAPTDAPAAPVSAAGAAPAAKPGDGTLDPKAAPPAPAGAAPDPAAEAQRQRFAEVTRLQTQNLGLTRELGTAKQKLAALEKSGVDMDALKAEAKKNPLKVMQAVGLDFKEVAEFVINSKDGPEDPLAREVAELKGKLTLREQQEAQARLDGEVKAAKGAIQGIIDKGAEYELLKVYQSAAGETGADLVFQVMLEHFEQHGAALEETVAAQAAEDWLAGYGETLAGTQKVQERLAAKAEAKRVAEEQEQAAAKASGKKPTDAKKPGATLSNNATAALSAGSDDDDKAVPGTLGWDRRIARVAEKLKAQQQ